MERICRCRRARRARSRLHARPQPDPGAGPNEAFTRPGVAHAWDRLHPRLTHRSAWLDHDGDLPVIDGTLIRLQVDHLPGDRDPKPVAVVPGHQCPAR
jgi:hypothetical protein